MEYSDYSDWEQNLKSATINDYKKRLKKEIKKNIEPSHVKYSNGLKDALQIINKTD